jgi:hypothetical protein
MPALSEMVEVLFMTFMSLGAYPIYISVHDGS